MVKERERFGRGERACTPLRCIATKKKSFNAMENKKGFNVREEERENDGQGDRKAFDRG